MKILYAIQGTGNGHVARAEEIIPQLCHYGKVDIFLSGAQSEIQLPYPIKFRSKGLSFYFGKKGGIDFYKTFKFNSSKRVIREIQELPVENYDLVINDFEAISAWACRKKKIPCYSLSHQFSLLSSRVPKPKNSDPVGSWFLKNYAPVKSGVGFHFGKYDRNILTPVIRARIRTLKTQNSGHYTIYLPAYGDQILVQLLEKFPAIKWQVFSKHSRIPYKVGNIQFFPVQMDQFVKSLAGCSGIICGAGFETPAESLYLSKKVLVVPMENQYEQHCNAAALKSMGVPVLKKLNAKSLSKISSWIESDDRPKVIYPDVAGLAVEQVFKLHAEHSLADH